MTEKKRLATLVPISTQSVGDLARKGWQHRNKHFFVDNEKDVYTSSSEDELSISWNSSPGTTVSKEMNVKNSRHVITKLNFEDCVVKNNHLPTATVERIIKPMNMDESSIISQSQNLNNNECIEGVYEHHNNSINSNCSSVTDEVSYVPETPGVGTSKTNCFDCLNSNKKSTEDEASVCRSQEIAPHSPPRRFDLEKYFQNIAPIVQKSPQNYVTPSCKKECNSSPIVASSKKKIRKYPFLEQERKRLLCFSVNNCADLNANLIESVEMTFQESDGSVLEQKVNFPCAENLLKTFNEQGNIPEKETMSDDGVNILQSPANVQTCESRAFTSSPIVGSKKKRHFRKCLKNRKSKRNSLFHCTERKNMNYVQKNKENKPSCNELISIPLDMNSICAKPSLNQNVSTVQVKLTEEFSEISEPLRNISRQMGNLNCPLQRCSSQTVSNEINNVANFFMTSGDIIQAKDTTGEDESIKSKSMESTNNLVPHRNRCRLQVEDKWKGGNGMDTLNNSIPVNIHSSQALMCVSSNRISRNSVRDEPQLINFASNSDHFHGDMYKKPTYTQETVTFVCFCGSQNINSPTNNLRNGEVFDIVKRDQRDAVSFTENCNVGIAETVCDKTNYVTSMNSSPKFCNSGENTETERKIIFMSQDTDAVDVKTCQVAENKMTSQSSIMEDVIGCSQVTLESRETNKSFNISFKNKNVGNFYNYNRIAFQHAVSMPTDKPASIMKSNSLCVQKDILNTSLHIENVTSDEETELPMQDKHRLKIVARRITFKQRKSVNMTSSKMKTDVHSAEGGVHEINEIDDTEKRTQCSNIYPLIFAQNPQLLQKNISLSNQVQQIGCKTAQGVINGESNESCIISQELSPRNTENNVSSDDSHITPRSLQDIEEDQHTPSRTASPCMKTDSGKKRKRLKKNGLVARLQRLLTCKRSAAHLCKYELSVGTRRPGDSVLLVQSAWLECSRLLVQCTPYSSAFQVQSYSEDLVCKSVDTQIHNAMADRLELFQSWVAVMDPAMLPVGKLKANSVIKIYAPWQIMQVPRLSTTLILDITHAELVSVNSSIASSEVASTLYKADTFHCPCMDGTSASKNCEYLMPDGGKSLSRLLFPILQGLTEGTNDVCLLQTVIDNPKGHNGTIAEAVVCHSHGLLSSTWLCVTVVKIFCFRSSDVCDYTDKICKSYNLTWSVLGEDSRGEICEIVLGSPHEDRMTQEWENIICGAALGKCYRINCLNVTKRHPFDSVHGVWKFAKNDLDKGSQDEDYSVSRQQMFFHVFSISSEAWNMECKGKKPQMKTLVKMTTLVDVLKKVSVDEHPCRLTVLVKAVVFWNNYLYITDSSLFLPVNDAQLPSCARVSVKSSCHLPDHLLANVFCLQDLLLSEGSLVADKYCRVFAYEENNEICCASINPANVAQIRKSSPHIPNLQTESKYLDLVIVTGHVVGVDEKTALSWPICKQCGRDLIEHSRHHQLLCESCGLTDPVTKLSLEIFLKCLNVPNIQVKVKLLQKSILTLLPAALDGTGFEVESVLGKLIGPLPCVLLESCPSTISRSSSFSMLLQEVCVLS